MTVHKLNAGDGYVYLTKHVAKGDATESRKPDAVDYYLAKGTPPGIWCGKLAEKVGVEVGTEVTESAMRSVFGAARTPTALDTKPGPGASVEEHLNWSQSTALGRAFSWFQNSQEYVHDVEELCTAYKAQHGEYPATQTKKDIQFSTARKHLSRESGERAGLLSDEGVWKFVNEQYNKARQAVAGYDLVFTPMKSISLLWGLGEAQVKAAVEEAHKQAVDEALEWIEDQVIYTRRGKGGERKVKAEGLLIARFDHFDNRAADPNLHTHSAVLNRVYAEGRWTTIDGSILYKANVSASEKYNTRVADLVARKLGVTFAPRPDTPVGKQPVYEVEGIPLSLIEEFSRRAAIEARQEELARDYKTRYGKNPPKKVQYAQAQQATLDTRNAKNPPRSLAELRAEWRERAEAILAGNNPAELVESVRGERDRRPVLTPQQVPALVDEVVDTLSHKVGSWTVFSVTAEIERRLREFSFADDEQLRAVHDDALELALRDYCLPIDIEEYHLPERISDRVERGRRRSLLVDRAQMRYTAQSVLDAEDFMRQQAEMDDEHTVDDRIIRRKLRQIEQANGHELGADQLAMITHFLTAGKRVAVAVGAAGAGKTTAATVIARAWEAVNGNVIALGPSARAAEVLGEEISVEGRTIADVLTRDRVGIPTGIARGDLLLVDEAGMASARDLADLTRIATEAGAVVRLLGDPQQLASVEAGGVLRDLADRTNAPFLRKVHRFATVGEAEASLHLREGDVTVLEWYEQNDRIRQGMAHELADLVFDAYVADVEAGQVALMVAPTNDLVRELNEKAAAYYRAGGTVTGPGIVLADGLEAAVGDVVVTRKNNSKYVVKDSDGNTSGRVKNGDLWTVAEIGDDGSLRLRNNISGGQVTVAADYITDNVQLGYATTVHRSQGMTVGSCHVLAGANMDRQSLYVALTRGKNTNIVYAANDELPDWDFEHRPDEHPGAIGLLAKIIARDGSQRTVHQMIEDEQRKAASWSTLTNTYMLAVGELYEDYTEQLLNRILTEEQFGWVHSLGGWDAIVTYVAQSETFGWDTEALLREAASVMSSEGKAGRIDTEANSPGQVIARALKTRIDSGDGAQLPRRRTDAVAAYRVPALTDAAAATDPILAAYARSCEQQMHAFIDSYTTTALEQNAPWITAIGQRGTDPRRVRLWETTVREIAISRVLADAADDENDPMAHLREARKKTIAANIERLNRPAPATDEVVGPYARYTDAELNSARMVSRGRLTEDTMLLSLAHEELDRARGDMSATAAVERSLAQVEIDERNIAAVRAARARLDALTRSPHVTEQQITAARAAVAAAEQAAPPERRWPVIERGAQHYRAAEAAKARARATDDQAIGRITDRITRLEESIAAERTILGQIDAEITRRSAGGTDFTTGHARTPTQTDSAVNHQIDRDPLEPDTGPERDL
ncbi:relaxase domain-containing protein (plasmid) [Rhodococcus pyridinivorans]|uniref:MobF family relaxase n=1 Tax=Rhodococcus pyridinivorans TaxID=103816 RepID=UPI0020C70594|nr:MobF family relaxase [Rhodococcus pyridinivorans]UTM39815.1 relaxase domain-containing protein [Rhodococcus pyridinivorans]